LIPKKYRHTKNQEGNLYKLLFLFSSFILIGCGSSVYYEIPYDLKNEANRTAFMQKYSPYVKDKVIFIDPGHGGSDRKNKGYQDLAVEADVNLNVSLYLRDFLEEAGAVVIMSRIKDETVELKKRPELANRSGADIFLSIHHNAPGTEGDNWTNYTSVYYHSKESEYNYEPSERDLARYIQRDLSYAMRNSGGPGSFDGTYSDYSIYPGEGFAVLRLTEIPAVLVECGFHTNTHEEKRLIIDEFNKIQAWGIFRGLSRYFSAGIPEIEFPDSLLALKAGDIKPEIYS
jgi:N-acetylmuramoyl-L-alanine amidase